MLERQIFDSKKARKGLFSFGVTSLLLYYARHGEHGIQHDKKSPHHERIWQTYSEDD